MVNAVKTQHVHTTVRTAVTTATTAEYVGKVLEAARQEPWSHTLIVPTIRLPGINVDETMLSRKLSCGGGVRFLSYVLE